MDPGANLEHSGVLQRKSMMEPSSIVEDGGVSKNLMCRHGNFETTCLRKGPKLFAAHLARISPLGCSGTGSVMMRVTYRQTLLTRKTKQITSQTLQPKTSKHRNPHSHTYFANLQPEAVFMAAQGENPAKTFVINPVNIPGACSLQARP